MQGRYVRARLHANGIATKVAPTTENFHTSSRLGSLLQVKHRDQERSYGSAVTG